jgi:hypothetical protein
METLTAPHVRAQDTAGVPRRVTYLGAAAFAVAAAWFWLAVKNVTVAAAPRTGPGVAPQQAIRIYYQWLATTLPQERYYTSIAIAGFGCLAVAAISLRALLGRDRVLATAGALAVGSGAALWVTGSVFELGGHHAVGLMATHANPIETTNSIAFTIDTITDAFALAGFTLIGAGMLAFAAAALNRVHRTWAGGTVIVAVAMLVTAAAFAVGNDSFSDLMVFASGIVLLPGWLVWTGRIRRTHDAHPAAR